MATIDMPAQRAVPALFETERGVQRAWVIEFIDWCRRQPDQMAKDVGRALARRDYSVAPSETVLARYRLSRASA